MSSSSPPSALRVSILALLALLVLGVGIVGVSTYRHGSVTTAPAAVAPAAVAPAVTASTPSPAPATTQAPPSTAPAFDIVRVAPDGRAVIAGRSDPGAKVTVQENGVIVGQAQADGRGTWVMTPSTSLKPGAGELKLSAQTPAGPVKEAEAPVVIVVPTPASPTQATASAAGPNSPGAGLPSPNPPALAFLAPPSAPPTLLQAPGPAVPGQKLGLDTVDYDERGAIRFSGTAPAAAPIRVYVDNGAIGDAKAGTDGHWALSPPGEVQPGVHTLRLDQLTDGGKVTARVELPFQREALAAAQVAAGQVVVQPGQNLWRLARRAYGAGIRYTVIFMANRDQIRDARLIYPGQMFAVPEAGSAAAASAPAPAVTH